MTIKSAWGAPYRTAASLSVNWRNMVILRLYKVGRSVVMTLPRSILEQLKLLRGDRVGLRVENNTLIVSPLEPHQVGMAPLAATDQHIGRAIKRGDE